MRLHANTTISLIPGIDGDVQVVASRSGHFVIDVQGAHCDVDGVLRHDHGTVRLTYDAVRDLRDLLEQLAEPIETRQERLPGIRGNTAHTMKPMPSRFRRPV